MFSLLHKKCENIFTYVSIGDTWDQMQLLAWEYCYIFFDFRDEMAFLFRINNVYIKNNKNQTRNLCIAGTTYMRIHKNDIIINNANMFWVCSAYQLCSELVNVICEISSLFLFVYSKCYIDKVIDRRMMAFQLKSHFIKWFLDFGTNYTR